MLFGNLTKVYIGVVHKCGMDQLDREILNELLKDSRKPTSEISRILGKPNSTIDFRIKKMVEKDIIQGFTVITDQSALSKTFAQVIVDVEKPFFKEKYREVIEDVAYRLAEKIMAQVPGWLENPMTESELAAEMTRAASIEGAEGTIFPTLVSCGEKMLAYHSPPLPRPIKENDGCELASSAGASIVSTCG